VRVVDPAPALCYYHAVQTPPNPWFLPVVAALFGAVVGSFLNVVIHRLPAGESIVFPGSRCPRCGAPIRPWDNIPVLGWVALGGRCRDCREPIALRYPLVELANALLWAALALRFGPGLPFLVFAAFCSALLAITMIDLDHWIIPDVITLPGIVVGLAASFFVPPRESLLADLLHRGLGLDRLPGALSSPGFWDSLAALLLGGGLFYLVAVLSRGGMGGGDIKLTAMMGAFLGLRDLGVAVFIGLISGSVVGIGLMIAGRKTRKDLIPFGPFLALGGVTAVFWARPLVDWYLRLRGF
jgi:leader peptidase (prepilin peptidase)/N-methyltransferase